MLKTTLFQARSPNRQAASTKANYSLEVAAMSKIKMNAAEYEFLTKEWEAGILLSPYYWLNECLSASSPRSWRNKNEKYDKSDEICSEIADLFLDCTAYRTSEDAVLREAEKELMSGMLNYLLNEAPPDEQHMVMLCELCRAEIQNDYSRTSDLERLFHVLEEKNAQHPAVLHFKAYLESSAGRGRTIGSLCRRLSPLFSFQGDEEISVFEHSGRDELLEMAVGLLQNCSGRIESATSLKTKTDEVAFLTSALHLMHDAYPSDKRNAKHLYQLLNNPSTLESQLKENLQAEVAIKYWKHCRKNIMVGK
jgi:hypothetical protein